MPPQLYYAVVVGRNPGVYTSWGECQKQVSGYPRAVFKGGFSSNDKALAFILEKQSAMAKENNNSDSDDNSSSKKKKSKTKKRPRAESEFLEDGDAFGNWVSSKKSRVANNNAGSKKKSSSSSSSSSAKANKIAAKEQKREEDYQNSLKLIAKIESEPGVIVCYTDGSSLNQGTSTSTPCGYGYAIQRSPEKEPLCTIDNYQNIYHVERAGFLGQGGNNLGEMTAIQKSLKFMVDYILGCKRWNKPNAIYILTDSEWSYKGFTGQYAIEKQPHKTRFNEAKFYMGKLQNEGIKVEVHWITAHRNIPGNDKADELADRGAKGDTLA